MAGSPIIQTMDGMLQNLREAIKARSEAERQITEYTNALRALAKVIEDREVGDSYLVTLDELSGKPGFLDAIRTVFRVAKKDLTPTEIRAWIQLGKQLDLSVYSNAMASIHTTLRRMKESGEIEEFINDKGEKAYRPMLKPTSSGRITPPPQAPRTLRRL